MSRPLLAVALLLSLCCQALGAEPLGDSVATVRQAVVDHVESFTPTTRSERDELRSLNRAVRACDNYAGPDAPRGLRGIPRALAHIARSRTTNSTIVTAAEALADDALSWARDRGADADWAALAIGLVADRDRPVDNFQRSTRRAANPIRAGIEDAETPFVRRGRAYIRAGLRLRALALRGNRIAARLGKTGTGGNEVAATVDGTPWEARDLLTDAGRYEIGGERGSSWTFGFVATSGADPRIEIRINAEAPNQRSGQTFPLEYGIVRYHATRSFDWFAGPGTPATEWTLTSGSLTYGTGTSNRQSGTFSFTATSDSAGTIEVVDGTFDMRVETLSFELPNK